MRSKAVTTGPKSPKFLKAVWIGSIDFKSIDSKMGSLNKIAAAINEPKMIADYLLKGIEPAFEIKEQTILRYWQEIVVENQAVNQLKDSGNLNQDNHFDL